MLLFWLVGLSHIVLQAGEIIASRGALLNLFSVLESGIRHERALLTARSRRAVAALLSLSSAVRPCHLAQCKPANQNRSILSNWLLQLSLIVARSEMLSLRPRRAASPSPLDLVESGFSKREENGADGIGSLRGFFFSFLFSFFFFLAAKIARVRTVSLLCLGFCLVLIGSWPHPNCLSPFSCRCTRLSSRHLSLHRQSTSPHTAGTPN